MSGFEEMLGQSRAIDQLRGFLRSGRLPHALLFHGPAGVGKATVARLFAASLLCREEREDACGACDSCRMLASGGHTDLLTVVRQPKKGTATGDGKTVAEADLSKFIVVDQIRQVSRLAALTPRHGRRRVFVFDPADRMNREAQNALLKTLEEPPPRAVLILISSRPRVLIPTVRSRVFALPFTRLRAAELSKLLVQRGFPVEEASARAALAEGRPGRALDIDLELLIERRANLMETLQALADSPTAASDLSARATWLAGKDDRTLTAGLDLMQTLLRDAARSGFDGDGSSLVHADLRESILRLGRRLGPGRAATLVGAIDGLRGDLRLNLNRTLVAETLLAAVAGGRLPGES